MMDLEKRNRVIRRHLPEAFEEGAPIEKERLTDALGNPVDAVLMEYDETGELTQACAIINESRLVNLSVDDAELREALRDLRDDPLQSGTIVVDTSSLPRTSEAWPMNLGLGLLADGRYGRFYGKSAEQLAQELSGLNPATGQREQRAVTISLEEFFDGNADEASIAPNRPDHEPPLHVFRKTLEALQSQPGVKEVRILVHEWPEPDSPEDDDMWIAAESVYVWAKNIDVDEIRSWVDPLAPDGVGEVPASSVPEGGPAIDPGDRVFCLAWD